LVSADYSSQYISRCLIRLSKSGLLELS